MPYILYTSKAGFHLPLSTLCCCTPGKSTLINAIVGQKLSIVTYKPQTTRHRVVGIASAPQYQMILFDTPGIMNEQRNMLDERMMAAVVSSIKAAEVIIAVVDSGKSPLRCCDVGDIVPAALGLSSPSPCKKTWLQPEAP